MRQQPNLLTFEARLESVHDEIFHNYFKSIQGNSTEGFHLKAGEEDGNLKELLDIIQRVVSHDFEQTESDARLFAKVLINNEFEDEQERRRFESLIESKVPESDLDDDAKLYRKILTEYFVWKNYKQDLEAESAPSSSAQTNHNSRHTGRELQNSSGDLTPEGYSYGLSGANQAAASIQRVFRGGITRKKLTEAENPNIVSKIKKDGEDNAKAFASLRQVVKEQVDEIEYLQSGNFILDQEVFDQILEEKRASELRVDLEGERAKKLKELITEGLKGFREKISNLPEREINSLFEKELEKIKRKKTKTAAEQKLEDGAEAEAELGVEGKKILLNSLLEENVAAIDATVEARLEAENEFKETVIKIYKEKEAQVNQILFKNGFSIEGKEERSPQGSEKRVFPEEKRKSDILYLVRDDLAKMVRESLVEDVMSVIVDNVSTGVYRDKGYNPLSDPRHNKEGLRKDIRSAVAYSLREDPRNQSKYPIGFDTITNRQFTLVEVAAATKVAKVFKGHTARRKMEDFRSVIKDVLTGNDTVVRDEESELEYQRVENTILDFNPSSGLAENLGKLAKLREFALEKEPGRKNSVEAIFYANLCQEMPGLDSLLKKVGEKLPDLSGSDSGDEIVNGLVREYASEIDKYYVTGYDNFNLSHESAFSKLVNSVNSVRKWIGSKEKDRASELDRVLRTMIEKNQEEIAKIKEDVKQLDERLTMHANEDETRHVDLEQRQRELERTQKELIGKQQELEARQNALEDTVKALGGTVDKNTAEIAGLTEWLNGLDERFGELGRSFVGLQGQFKLLDDETVRRTEYDQFVNDIDLQRKTMEGQIRDIAAEYNEKIGALTDQIASLANQHNVPRVQEDQPAFSSASSAGGAAVGGFGFGVPGRIDVHVHSDETNLRLHELREQIAAIETQRANDIVALTARFNAVDEITANIAAAIERAQEAINGLVTQRHFDDVIGNLNGRVDTLATTDRLNVVEGNLRDRINEVEAGLNTAITTARGELEGLMNHRFDVVDTRFNQAERDRRADSEKREKQIADLGNHFDDELSRMMAEMSAQNTAMRRELEASRKEKADAESSSIVDFDKVREMARKGLLSDVMVESIRGGGEKGKFEIKPYGLTISMYDGLEIAQHSTHVRLAHEAWSRASSGEHDDNTRYTSFTGSKQPSLISISRITNRPIPGGETPSYMITTVDKNGVGQIFMSDDVFEREINRPLADAYELRLAAIKTALQNGDVPSFEDVMRSGVDDSGDSVKVRLIERAIEKSKKENLANDEREADKSLIHQYQSLISLVDDKEVKKRIDDFLAKGDYDSVRGSFVNDEGGLREDLFYVDRVEDARDFWKPIEYRNADHNGHIDRRYDLYRELAELINDGAVQEEWGLKIDEEEYDKLYDLLKGLDAGTTTDGDKAEKLRQQLLEVERSFFAPRVALYEELAELIKDSDLKKEFKQLLRDGKYEDFLERAREDFTDGEIPAAIHLGVFTDETKANEIFVGIFAEFRNPSKSVNLVSAHQEYREGNYALILNALEEEHKKLDEFIKSREANLKARGEFNFTRDRYQKLVDAMADRPSKADIKLMLGTESTERTAYLARLFEQGPEGNYVNECVFSDGTFDGVRVEYLRIVASDRAVLGGEPATVTAEERQRICQQIIDAVDPARPSKSAMQQLLNEGSNVAEALFNIDAATGVVGVPKFNGLFDKIERDLDTKAVTAFEGDNNPPVGRTAKWRLAQAIAEESQAKTPAAKLQRDTFVSHFIGVAPETEKRDELASVIKHIKDHEVALKQGKGNVHHLCKRSIAAAVQSNGLSEKIAAEIAAKASVVHGDTLLQRKVEVANIINSDVAMLSPEEKLRLAGKDKNLQRVFDMKFPPTAYGGAAFSRKAYNEHAVMFNGDFGEVADPAAKGSGFPAKYCYIPVPGRDDVFVRAAVCTVNNMTPKYRSVKDPVTGEKSDERYYVMEVRKNGKIIEEEHKPGDVVMDYNTVHHMTVMKDGKGNPVIDVKTGKPKVHYKEVSLEGSYESTGKAFTKAVNAVADLASLGVMKRFGAGGLFESKTAGELEFGVKEFAEIRKHYRDMKILVGSVGANGERNFSTLCNGEVINHSVGRATYVAAVIGKTPNPVVDRNAFAEDGEHLKFTFNAEFASLKGGSYGVIEHRGNPYYGNSMYVKSKELVLPDIELFGKVSVISHNANGESRCSEMGDVVFSTNIFYRNAAGQCLPIFDSLGKVEAAFVSFAESKGVTTDQSFYKRLGEMRTRLPDATSATVSVEHEALNLPALAVQDSDGKWKLDNSRHYKTKGLATKIEIQPGTLAPASSDMKRDLLQSVASQELRDEVSVEKQNLDFIRQGRIESQNREETNRTRKAIRFTPTPDPKVIMRERVPIEKVPVRDKVELREYWRQKFTGIKTTQDDIGVRGS